MNSLDKFKLSYEYDQTPSEIKKLFRSIRNHNKSILAEIKKQAKAGKPIKDLSRQYDMTVQKINYIVRKK